MTVLLLFIVYAVVLSSALVLAGHRSREVSPGEGFGGTCSRVLIVGATGGTGRQLVGQALQRGYAVTAFVRDLSRLELSHPQLTVIRGDVLDAESLEAAMRGQDAVLSALGHKRFFFPARILSEGTSNIVRMMQKHGVRRFVCETSLGIGDSAGRMGLYYTLFVIPLILPLYFWDKTRQERIIAASDLDWVIVRPAVLTNGEARARYRHGRRVGNYLLTARVSRADVADFMLNQLTSDAYLRTTPGIAG